VAPPVKPALCRTPLLIEVKYRIDLKKRWAELKPRFRDARPMDASAGGEFHRQTGRGGSRRGELWEVTRRDGSTVHVAKDGKERALPLHRAEDFHAYQVEAMPLAIGERVLITKNNRAANLTKGDRRGRHPFGKRPPAGPVQAAPHPAELHDHLTNQPRARTGMFGLLTVSATSQINAVQMLVSLSRASREVHLYTDSIDVLKEMAIQPGQGRSVVELIEGTPKAKEAGRPAKSNMNEYEKMLREEAASRFPSPTPKQSAAIEQEIERLVQESEARINVPPPQQGQAYSQQQKEQAIERQ
jgi:hypothetical protein